MTKQDNLYTALLLKIYDQITQLVYSTATKDL